MWSVQIGLKQEWLESKPETECFRSNVHLGLNRRDLGCWAIQSDDLNLVN